MALPTQFELCNMFYLCKQANPLMTDAQILADIKGKWQQSAKQLRNAADPREYEMTPAEIEAANIQQAADGATSLAALKIVWQRELAEEIAGHNRPNVIAELQANLAL